MKSLASGNNESLRRNINNAENREVDSASSAEVVPPLLGTTLLVFTSGNRFRIICHEIVHHPLFNNFFLMWIIASSICLASNNPDSSPELVQSLDIADRVFTVIFSVEVSVVIFPSVTLSPPSPLILIDPLSSLSFSQDGVENYLARLVPPEKLLFER